MAVNDTSVVIVPDLGDIHAGDGTAVAAPFTVEGDAWASHPPDYTVDNYTQPAEQAPIIEWDTIVELVYQGDVVASSADRLAILGGAVHQSNRRNYRSSLRNVRLVDPDSDPDIRWLLSHRSGAELVPTIRWTSGGVTRTEQLGVFRPHRSQITETFDGLEYQMAGWDRAWTVDRAGITGTPIRIDDDTDAAAAIEQVVNGVLATPVEIVTASTGITVARTTWRPGDKPWSDAVTALAQAGGVEAWFDRQGRLNIIPLTTPTDADWELTDQVLEVSTVDDSAGWGNGVTMISTAPWLLFGISATVWDDDPSSPTYYLGPAGKNLVTVENPAIYSAAAADTAARAELERLRGADADLEWAQIPDPRIAPGQIVDVRRTNLGISDRYRIDEVTIPFRPGPVECVARQIGAVA